MLCTWLVLLWYWITTVTVAEHPKISNNLLLNLFFYTKQRANFCYLPLVSSFSAYNIQMLNTERNFLMLTAIKLNGNVTECYWHSLCLSLLLLLKKQRFRTGWSFHWETDVRVWNYCRRWHWRFTGVCFLLYQMLDLRHSLVAYDTMGVFCW